jgi:TetR/AcrR family transcriptional regulator, transcriptional repressor for nem operon
MPRTKLYCEDTALNKATELFTRHGYNGTSLAMLTDALNMGKQSLYDCFGDKRQLLSSCLANAAQQFRPARHLLESRLSARVSIERFFDAIIAECLNVDHPGCLVCVLLLEKGQSDPNIRDEAAQFWRQSEQALHAQCERGVGEGSIVSASNAKVLSATLITWLSGLRIAARVGSVVELKASNAAFLRAVLG